MSRLVNTFGETFSANTRQALPAFVAPAGSAAEVVRRYHRFSELVAPLGTGVERVVLTQRLAWQLRLGNGLHVMLGRDADLAEQRLKKFVDAHSATLARTGKKHEYVDLRYPNGFALRVPGITQVTAGWPRMNFRNTWAQLAQSMCGPEAGGPRAEDDDAARLLHALPGLHHRRRRSSSPRARGVQAAGRFCSAKPLRRPRARGRPRAASSASPASSSVSAPARAASRFTGRLRRITPGAGRRSPSAAASGGRCPLPARGNGAGPPDRREPARPHARSERP